MSRATVSRPCFKGKRGGSRIDWAGTMATASHIAHHASRAACNVTKERAPTRLWANDALRHWFAWLVGWRLAQGPSLWALRTRARARSRFFERLVML